MTHTAQQDHGWHTECLAETGAPNQDKPGYIHTNWPKTVMQPADSTRPWPCPADETTTARHHLVSKSLMKSAQLLLPHAFAVAFFFMALLMARPFIAAFFITLLAFFAFMAAVFMAPAFFIAFFMAAMTLRGTNVLDGRAGSCFGPLSTHAQTCLSTMLLNMHKTC